MDANKENAPGAHECGRKRKHWQFFADSEQARAKGKDAFERYSKATGLVLAELFWPTRCVICEAYGSLLCDDCRNDLTFIDQWLACPRCGAPYGFRQCTECNRFSLDQMGLKRLPYDECVSAVAFTDCSARVVRCHKDAGERGLACHIAYFMACAIPPEWAGEDVVVTYVPATSKAKRRRGFDHGQAVGMELAGMLGLACVPLLHARDAKDQRRLGRSGRFENASERFSAESASFGKRIILADDVYTTGATLMSASAALRDAGAVSVRCVTFARVY